MKEFANDPVLESFKQKYETMFNAFKDSVDNEMKQIKKYF